MSEQDWMRLGVAVDAACDELEDAALVRDDTCALGKCSTDGDEIRETARSLRETFDVLRSNSEGR